jgi:ABC-type phosphate/phosphonate transport system ATPase subunit
MESLERINNMGKTVIVVTHEKALVDHFKKRVITIKNGHIVNDQAGGAYSYKKPENQLLLPEAERKIRSEHPERSERENKNE